MREPTGTEALRARGFVHANRGYNRRHAIYDTRSGALVAYLYAEEVWPWLRGERVEGSDPDECPACHDIPRSAVCGACCPRRAGVPS